MLKAVSGPVLSHWSTLIEDFHTSAVGFYEQVAARVERREVPEATPSTVDWRESGLLSAKREYLRVERGEFIVDICAAPFGTGYFFSSWLTEKQPGIGEAIGFLAAFLFVFMFFWVILWSFLSAILGGFAGTLLTMFTGLASAPFLFWGLAQAWGEEKVVKLPVIGPVYGFLFRPQTYYRYDTAQMFQKAVHNAVLEVIDEITTAQGLRALAESERKPALHGLLNRSGA